MSLADNAAFASARAVFKSGAVTRAIENFAADFICRIRFISRLISD
jgi:hypothetical protein